MRKLQALRNPAAALPIRRKATHKSWLGLLAGFSAALLAPWSAAQAAPVATVTLLHGFSFTEARQPTGLVVGKDGNLYGASFAGGLPDPLLAQPVWPLYSGLGTIFQLAPSGACNVVYNFNYNAPGALATPLGQLVSPFTFSLTGQGPGPLAVDVNGTVFGTTMGSVLDSDLIQFLAQGADYLGNYLPHLIDLGASLHGTVASLGRPGGGTFMFTPLLPGVLLPRYQFDPHQLQRVAGPLVPAADGSLYGILYTYASATAAQPAVSIFRVDSLNRISTIYSYPASPDARTQATSLMQASDGNFYGVTYAGGTGNAGSVFRLSPQGLLTTLHSFSGPDGSTPASGLVQGRDGNLYGTTFYGGAYGYGAVYRITPGGALTLLHSFNNADGAYPSAALLLGRDGNLYGSTYAGGAEENVHLGFKGTLFVITPGGAFTKLHDFNSNNPNPLVQPPVAALVQAADGTMYGISTYVASVVSDRFRTDSAERPV